MIVAMDLPISWYRWASPSGPSKTNRNLGKENKMREKNMPLLKEHPRKSLGAPSPERGSRGDT